MVVRVIDVREFHRNQHAFVEVTCELSRVMRGTLATEVVTSMELDAACLATPQGFTEALACVIGRAYPSDQVNALVGLECVIHE